MAAAWFHFDAQDFAYSFLSVLLEGVPFLLFGTLLSGLIDQFLPSRLMARLLPGNVFLGICLSGLMGIVFPMCECGIVPVIRRLIGKGLPVSNAVAYMIAAPIVNPVVAASTLVAFRGQDPFMITALRLGLGFAVAVVVGLAVHNLSTGWVVKKEVLASIVPASDEQAGHAPGMRARLVAAMEAGVKDFLDVALYFIPGVAAASVFGTAVNQQMILPLALNPWLAVGSMMSLAMVLSLCSTSDAFVAATFTAFPAAAKLAFLVFGPMMDLKLLFIYGAVFNKRFIAGLAAGLFVLVGLLCVRLATLSLLP